STQGGGGDERIRMAMRECQSDPDFRQTSVTRSDQFCAGRPPTSACCHSIVASTISSSDTYACTSSSSDVPLRKYQDISAKRSGLLSKPWLAGPPKGCISVKSGAKVTSSDQCCISPRINAAFFSATRVMSAATASLALAVAAGSDMA